MERRKMPPYLPLLRKRRGGGNGGAESYVLSSILGPKSTDPNLEPEAPSLTFWW